VSLMRIRNAREREAPELEALQRRSSDVWDEYREQLAAHPDAIEFPQHFIDHGWTRVAVLGDDTPVGFSVVIPGQGGAHELDGLFVEPERMRRGIGRSLVEDACERARKAREVTLARGRPLSSGHTSGPARSRIRRMRPRLRSCVITVSAQPKRRCTPRVLRRRRSGSLART